MTPDATCLGILSDPGQAIEKRLLVAPERYSEPLRRTLKGYRKLRVEDYRIVLKLQDQEILILAIYRCKDVYQRMEWRI